MSENVSTVLQVVGSLLILVPFLLVQMKRLRPDALPYVWLNLVGSTVLALDAWHGGQCVGVPPRPRSTTDTRDDKQCISAPSWKGCAMRAVAPAVLGVLFLLIAGFIRGGEANSPDPELVLGAFYALAGLGLIGVLAAGVAAGISLSRD